MAVNKETQAVLDAFKGVGDRLTSVEQRLAPAEALLKTLEEPAKRAGLTPEAMIARMTDGGNRPGTFDGNGNFLPVKGFNPHGKRIGAKACPDGKTRTFDDFLKAMYFWEKDKAPGALKVLQDCGAQRFGSDGAVTKTALAESSGVTGGYTVAPSFLPQLMTYALEGTIFPSRASKHPLTTRTMQIPSLDIATNNASQSGAGQTNFLGGVVASWEAEAQTRTESEPQFRQTTLTAWELSFYMIASNNLLADNAVGLDSLVTQLMSNAIGWHTDFAYFQGNGVGKPMGVLNAAAAIKVTRAAGANATSIYYSDIGKMLSKLYWPLYGDANVAFVGNPSVIPQIWALTDNSAGSGNGRLVFQPINQGAQEAIQSEQGGTQMFGYLAGKPLFISEKLPTLGSDGDLCLIHFPSYILGTRMELEIAVSPHYKFINNQMVWRVVWRGDGQPWLSSAITLSDNTNTVSPFVLLH